MNVFLNALTVLLTWLFFAGLLGACAVITLFLLDLFRTLSRPEPKSAANTPIPE